MTTPSLVSQSTQELPVPPQHLAMSYEEYLTWTDENTHAEWVNGEVSIHMPPKPRYQEVVGFLFVFLDLFTRLFQLGKVFTAPLEMRAIADGPAREPDLLFVARAHLERFTETRLSGPADLVVEVVSDDSVSRDRTEKFYEYQDAGIPEYWIIDPRPGRQRIDIYVLDASKRYRAVPVDASGRYHASVLPGLWLREDWFLAAALPDPLQALVQLVGPAKLLEALGLENAHPSL